MTKNGEGIEGKEPLVFKLKESEKVCTCGGKLRKLSEKEVKANNLKMIFSRGVYACVDCGDMFTINYRPVGLSFDRETWVQEDVHTEYLDSIGESMKMTEREAADKIIEELAFLPEGIEEVVTFVGSIFKCRTQGQSCQLYYLASSGLGDETLCGSRWCKYDPYPEEFKKRYWYKQESSWPKDEYHKDIVSYWSNIFDGQYSQEERLEAVRRIGNIQTNRVSDILMRAVWDEKDTEIRKAALTHLASWDGDIIRADWYRYLEDDDREVVRHSLKLLREINRVELEIIEKVAYITARKGFEKDATVTLRILRKKLERK